MITLFYWQNKHWNLLLVLRLLQGLNCRPLLSGGISMQKGGRGYYKINIHQNRASVQEELYWINIHWNRVVSSFRSYNFSSRKGRSGKWNIQKKGWKVCELQNFQGGAYGKPRLWSSCNSPPQAKNFWKFYDLIGKKNTFGA